MFKAASLSTAPSCHTSQQPHYRKRCLTALAFLGSLAAMASHTVFAADGDPVPASRYLQPQTLVEVEPGRSINLLCMGHGSPTVLLDSGLGDSSLSWREVQAELSRRTRVCSFDRAGYGFSDPMATPATAQAAVDDMSTLVARESLGASIVLVAHSLGGMHALLFAFEKPQAVAGMVLVDPAYPGQPDTGADAQQLAANRACLGAARTGLLAGAVPASLQHCLDSPPNRNAALHREMNRQWARVQNNAARLSENENLHLRDANGHSEDDRELLRHWHELDATPLIVLSAGTVWPATPTMTAAQARAKWSEHVAGHQRLAALSSRGRDIVVPDTTHYIQQIKPQAVIQAVDEVLLQARRDSRSPGSKPAAREPCQQCD